MKDKKDFFLTLIITLIFFFLCRIPIVKRGSAVPLYFTTADERILEYDFDKVIFQDDSPYQNIKILHSPTLGNCLMLDDLQSR